MDYNTPIFKHHYFEMAQDLQEIRLCISQGWCNMAEGWARDCAKETLPPHIFDDIDTNKFNCSQESKDYCRIHCLHKEYPDRIEFWHKGVMHPNIYIKPSL